MNNLFRKITLGLLLVVASFYVNAINTTGYVAISEIKSWSAHIDVYLSDSQEHQCNGGHKTRFLTDSTEANHVSFLLSAFMAGKGVRLSYSCNENGYPQITGVRVR